MRFGNDVAFVYRHFPLGIFPHSKIAAQAAEAAGKQGKFWEMHDMIFDEQRVWSVQRSSRVKDTFVSYAEFLVLDIEQFKADIDSREVRNKVNRDHQSGVKAGVRATPTFFLNGERIQNPRTYDAFREIIQAAVDAEQSTQKKTFNRISVTESFALIQDNKDNQDFIVLDVRTKEECVARRLENTVNIDFYSDVFANEIDKLDKSKTYLVHCRSGNRSKLELPSLYTVGDG